MGMVREALERIQLVAKEEVKLETEEAMDDVQEIPQDAIPVKRTVETRKRKAPEVRKSAVAKEVVISDDSDAEHERAAKHIESLKPTNRANKTILNLYTKKSPSSPQMPTDKKKPQNSNRSTGQKEPSTAQPLPRGLGAVTDTVSPRESHVKFEHIGGADKQFLEVCRLAMHLKRPKTFSILGVDPPRGFIVHGPPGCGKTLFAQAVAGELGVPMLQLAATELVSGVSGETEEKIRRLFDTAKQNAPCILILDDIDAIAPRRETATREMERRVVSQLCSSLDG